jgi:hypothetical protein
MYMIRYSDNQLKLTPKWFTGKEWNNGIAQEYCRREYKERTKRFKGNPKDDKDIPQWILTALARW